MFGEVCGVDSHGNYKVRSKECGRTVILSHSSELPFEIGDKVTFEVTGCGRNVDFAKDYSRTRMGNANLITKSIDLVLVDDITGDTVVVGRWGKSDFVQHSDEGRICGRQYVLTHRGTLGGVSHEAIAEKLGISVD